MDVMVASGAKRVKAAHLWKRDELDWYVEPRWVTTGLLRKERFEGTIWDPACGGGNILSACREAGYRVVGTDIVDRGAVMNGLIDFLVYDGPSLAPNIIMNPPYFRAEGAETFIRKAISLATGKAAVFTDIRFLAGSGRAAGFFAEHPPHRIWTITPRCSCPPGTYLAVGNKVGNGLSDYCWLIWDFTAPVGDTRFGWLQCQK